MNPSGMFLIPFLAHHAVHGSNFLPRKSDFEEEVAQSLQCYDACEVFGPSIELIHTGGDEDACGRLNYDTEAFVKCVATCGEDNAPPNIQHIVDTNMQLKCEEFIGLIPGCGVPSCDNYGPGAEITPPLVHQDVVAFTEFKSCLDQEQCQQLLSFDQEVEFSCDTAPYNYAACVHYCMEQVSFVSHFLGRVVDPGSDIKCRNNRSILFSRHPFRCETTVCKKFSGGGNEKVATTGSNKTNKDLIGAKNELRISSSYDTLAGTISFFSR